MNTIDQLNRFRRPEIKAAVERGEHIWLGTSMGLFHLYNGTLEACEGWQGYNISTLALAEAGLLVGASHANEALLAVTGAEYCVLRRLPALPDKIKALLFAEGQIFAGGKCGLYRLDGDTWQHFAESRSAEISSLAVQDGRLLAFCKKQGAKAWAGLLVSTDGGGSWHLEVETGYHDAIIAVRDSGYLTRWRGAWCSGTPLEYEKRPHSVASQRDGVQAWIKGNILVCEFADGGSLEIKDPRFAEAEHLFLLDQGRALVAGLTGAFLVNLGHGQLQDLFEERGVAPQATKIKRLWSLEEGRILAVASFGTFFSDDGGAHWQPSQAEWAGLDAEGLAMSPDGAWYMATQRGLFSSWDNGESWAQVKFTTAPHFSELTGLAWAGDRLALGSKAGLFLSAAGQPKVFNWNPCVGATTVKGLLVDDDTLWVGTTDGRLLEVDAATGAGQLRALFQKPCQPLRVESATLVVLCGKQLYRVGRQGVEPVLPPAALVEIRDAVCSDLGLVAWDQDNGWILGSGADDQWQPVSDWLPAVKSITRGAPRLVTNRSEIKACP